MVTKLEDIRNRIDETDRELLALFLRRMELTASVAAYKAEKKLPILDGEREKRRLDAAAKGSGALSDYGRRFFASILELSRHRQRELMSAQGAPAVEARDE